MDNRITGADRGPFECLAFSLGCVLRPFRLVDCLGETWCFSCWLFGLWVVSWWPKPPTFQITIFFAYFQLGGWVMNIWTTQIKWRQLFLKRLPLFGSLLQRFLQGDWWTWRPEGDILSFWTVHKNITDSYPRSINTPSPNTFAISFSQRLLWAASSGMRSLAGSFGSAFLYTKLRSDGCCDMQRTWGNLWIYSSGSGLSILP